MDVPTAMVASAEIYDPAIGNWTAAADMPASRFAFSMLALPTGLVSEKPPARRHARFPPA